jgi:Raf kinase inhibitor-like YbhB/YbcL family protein
MLCHLRRCWIFTVAAIVSLPLLSLDASAQQPSPKAGGAAAVINLTSSAFAAEAAIPSKFTCDGADISPALAWQDVPAGTKSLVLICDDPDAPGGTWVHWVLYNLPPTLNGLPEKTPRTPTLPNGGVHGINDFDKTFYNGPCPPPGKPHHYFFKIYALDITLPLKPGAKKENVLQAMERHVLGEGVLMGKFQRKK